MIFSENGHQASFSEFERQNSLSNSAYHSGSSSSLSKNLNSQFQTKIAPVSFNLSNSLTGNFSYQPIYQSSINVSSFDSRIQNLQMKISEQKELSNICCEKNEYIRSLATSSLVQEINSIRYKIDMLVQGDVLPQGRKVSNDFKNTKKNINSLNYNNEASEIRSKTNNLVRDITLFKNSFNDHTEISQNSFKKLQFDHQRIKNQLSQSLSKISNIEAKHSTIIQKSDEQSHVFDQIDGYTLSSFSSLVQNSNELIQSHSSYLANDIKSESVSRGSVNILLQRQANTINENVVANIVRLTNDYKEISKSFNKMIQDTSTQISSALEDTQNEADSMIQSINQSFNPLFEDIEKKFEYLQNELISTISSLHQNSNDALLEIENVIEIESNTRKNNSKIFHDKFSQFEQFICNEKKIQSVKTKEMSQKILSVGNNLVDKRMAKPIKNTRSIVKTIKNLDEIESQINEIESSFNDTLNSVRDEIRKADLNISELFSHLETNNETNGNFRNSKK